MGLMMLVLSCVACVAGMAILYQKDAQFVGTAQTVTTTTETIIATGTAVPLEFNTAKAVVRGSLNITVGVGTTSLTLRIYRGSSIAGGTVIAGYFLAVTAGNNESLDITVTDALSGLGTTQYILTIQQTAATGNGNVLGACIETEILSG